MGAAQFTLYLVGAAVLLIGVGMLFFETGLSAWIPGGIALAGLVLLIGLLVMGLSQRTTEPEQPQTEVHEVHHHRRY